MKLSISDVPNLKPTVPYPSLFLHNYTLYIKRQNLMILTPKKQWMKKV